MKASAWQKGHCESLARSAADSSSSTVSPKFETTVLDSKVSKSIAEHLEHKCKSASLSTTP